jgi:hypothetical protein
MLAVAVACQDRRQTERASTPSMSLTIVSNERERLVGLANEGDAEAAKRLVLERYWVMEQTDAELLFYWRIWANSDVEGRVGLAHLLARSCDERHVQEARNLAARLLSDEQLEEEQRVQLQEVRDIALGSEERRSQDECFNLN